MKASMTQICNLQHKASFDIDALSARISRQDAMDLSLALAQENRIFNHPAGSCNKSSRETRQSVLDEFPTVVQERTSGTLAGKPRRKPGQAQRGPQRLLLHAPDGAVLEARATGDLRGQG